MRQQAIRRDRNELLEIQRHRRPPAPNGMPILAKVALIFWWAVVLVAAGASVAGANLCPMLP